MRPDRVNQDLNHTVLQLDRICRDVFTQNDSRETVNPGCAFAYSAALGYAMEQGEYKGVQLHTGYVNLGLTLASDLPYRTSHAWLQYGEYIIDGASSLIHRRGALFSTRDTTRTYDGVRFDGPLSLELIQESYDQVSGKFVNNFIGKGFTDRVDEVWRKHWIRRRGTDFGMEWYVAHNMESHHTTDLLDRIESEGTAELTRRYMRDSILSFNKLDPLDDNHHLDLSIDNLTGYGDLEQLDDLDAYARHLEKIASGEDMEELFRRTVNLMENEGIPLSVLMGGKNLTGLNLVTGLLESKHWWGYRISRDDKKDILSDMVKSEPPLEWIQAHIEANWTPKYP